MRDCLTSVRVIIPIGNPAAGATTEHIFGGAVADQFEQGVLTITAPGLEPKYSQLAQFQRGTWIRAVVYDIRGYPEYEFLAEAS